MLGEKWGSWLGKWDVFCRDCCGGGEEIVDIDVEYYEVGSEGDVVEGEGEDLGDVGEVCCEEGGCFIVEEGVEIYCEEGEVVVLGGLVEEVMGEGLRG